MKFVRTLIGIKVPKELFFTEGKFPTSVCKEHGAQHQGKCCMVCGESLVQALVPLPTNATSLWALALGEPIPAAWEKLVRGTGNPMLQVIGFGPGQTRHATHNLSVLGTKKLLLGRPVRQGAYNGDPVCQIELDYLDKCREEARALLIQHFNISVDRDLNLYAILDDESSPL